MVSCLKFCLKFVSWRQYKPMQLQFLYALLFVNLIKQIQPIVTKQSFGSMINNCQYYKYKMCQKTEKNAKLAEVYNEISNIKAQIYSLMQPSPQPNTNTIVNINIVPQNQASNQSQHQKPVNSQINKKEGHKDVIIKGAKCPAHYTSLKYLRSAFHQPLKQKQSRFLCQQTKNQFTGQLAFSKNSPKFPVYSKQNHNKVKYSPHNFKKVERLKTETQVQIIKVQQAQILNTVQQKNSKIKFFHTRHKSQVEPNTFKQLRKSKSNEKLKVSPEKQKEAFVKHTFLMKRTANPIKEQMQEKQPKYENYQNTKEKKLTRVRSDFIDLPGKDSEKRHISVASRQKISFLEQEIKKKDEVIALLSSQLQQIETKFSQIQSNLLKMLQLRGQNPKQLKKGGLNRAIEQVLKQLVQKEQKINSLNSQNSTISQKISALQQQNIELNNRLETLSSKLQATANQNKLKDQFIINYLLIRGQEQEKQGWVTQTLKAYLEKQGLHNTKLLQRLDISQQDQNRRKQP